jgi:exosortase/archaeosortase family protein
MQGVTDIGRARLRFVLVFTVVVGGLLALYSFPYAEHGIREGWFVAYLTGYARVAGFVLHLGDRTVQVVGADIVGRVSLTVAKNCDAMDVNILVAAAMLAHPASWSRRAIGIAASVAVLTAVNVARIASLYVVDVHWPDAFEFIHAEVWPCAMVALAVAAFLLWSRWALPPAQGTA